MRVLVACEFSGVVRDAFARRGHDAWSCDLLPSETPGQHIQRSAILVAYEGGWDLMIAHPPCTYLSRAGARWWKEPGRARLADEASAFVFALRYAPIARIAIENPIGQLNRRWRKPDQTIQPWMFGHPFTKATCLWLKRLPPLVPTFARSQRDALLPSNTGAGRRAGQKSQPGIVGGGKDASRTFPGVGAAMADQWGNLETEGSRMSAGKTIWTVIRNTGYHNSKDRQLYRDEDSAKAKEIYEYQVRVMRRGTVRMFIDDTECCDFTA